MHTDSIAIRSRTMQLIKYHNILLGYIAGVAMGTATIALSVELDSAPISESL